MSGSFWKFSNGFTSVSNVSTLIENYQINGDGNKLNVLMKLMDEDDLLQELVSNNSALLEFLRDDEILDILFELVINEGVVEDLVGEVSKLDIKDGQEKDEEKEDEEKDDKEEDKDDIKDDKEDKEDDDINDTKEEDIDDSKDNDLDDETDEERNSRRATIATEILSADVWSLTDTVMESTANLNKLWNVLDNPTPLSINLSTYFMKIMEHLLDMKCDEMIQYLIENQSNLVDKFVNHLSNHPLTDFLLKLISTDKPDNSTGIIDFFQNQQLIPKLIDSLNPKEGDSAMVEQTAAADCLKALITISANSTTDNSTIGPNELTRELVSYEMMSKLCDIMEKGGYALSNGVGIIIEIIRKNNSDYDILPILYITLESHPPTGRDPIYLGYLLKVFSERIGKFNSMLSSGRTSSVTPTKLITSLGQIEPLGFERFKVCELIAELLHCSNMALLNDNKGFEVVKERNELREKMKTYDPISFKYNEVIILPEDKEKFDKDHDFNDTIDSFNLKDDSVLHNYDDEPHENANLSEEEIRANPVLGDQWKISLYDTEIINNILEMFFKFPWNNFLHNVVFDIVQQVLNGSMDIGFNKFLSIDLFDRGDITNKIIKGQKLCDVFEKENHGLRLGYMGHLTLIAEEVVKFIQSYPTNTLSEIIDQKINEEAWEEYVSNILYDTREKYNAILGGGDEDEDEEDDNILNTFDELSGEVIEESDYKSGFLFEDKKDDEDDHFSNYMTQELVNPELPDKSDEEISSSDEDDEPRNDYIDPNDDGNSYKKFNPLYDENGTLISEKGELSDSDEEEEKTLTRSNSKS